MCVCVWLLFKSLVSLCAWDPSASWLPTCKRPLTFSRLCQALARGRAEPFAELRETGEKKARHDSHNRRGVERIAVRLLATRSVHEAELAQAFLIAVFSSWQFVLCVSSSKHPALTERAKRRMHHCLFLGSKCLDTLDLGVSLAKGGLKTAGTRCGLSPPGQCLRLGHSC